LSLGQPSSPAAELPERPLPADTGAAWGSDLLAEMLRELDIPYVALNPGASFRGLHDILVNHLGNERPRMLLCLHEENAVAIAHGWAKVTDTPMLAIVHSNIGLMHGAMALYIAWCDRVPMLLLGATGPVAPVKRRPFVDWLHTSKDQAAIVWHVWTGVHYRVPLLLIVANNGSYHDDELHQERVARRRGRPVENRWIGQRMSDPAIDLAMLARAQGATAFGPVERPEALEGVLRQAIATVEGDVLVVVDVRVAAGDAGAARGAST
jgi:thiamine pyrophosphate-dependent acetolactate synthase large subunit-like protein